MKRGLHRRGRKPGLKREINFFTAVMYGIGIILGAGIYALIGEAAGMAGNSVWLSFTFGAVVATFTGLSYMELISMFPKSAAEYIYVKNAFRNRLLAFNVGWVGILAGLIAASAVALGFAGYMHALFGVPVVPAAIGLIAVMSFVNFLGMGESARLNVVFSLVEVGGLLFVIAIALLFGHYGSVDYLEMPYGITGTLSAAALIFFAYIGFEEIANISEESKAPRKMLPKALLASVAITTALYIAVSMAAVSLVGWEQLAESKAPLAFAVSSVLGERAFWLMSVIALFATANTVLITMIVGSRMMYGMAKDGSLPNQFAMVHSKRFTPWVSVVAAMIVSMVFVLLGQIDLVASVTDLGTFYVFVVVNAAAILLRYRMPNARREFRMPLNVGRFPLISFFGLVSALILASHLSFEAMSIGALVVASGVIVYLLYTRKAAAL
jgi:APA family basic amino acid/polyamine antiporter